MSQIYVPYPRLYWRAAVARQTQLAELRLKALSQGFSEPQSPQTLLAVVSGVKPGVSDAGGWKYSIEGKADASGYASAVQRDRRAQPWTPV